MKDNPLYTQEYKRIGEALSRQRQSFNAAPFTDAKTRIDRLDRTISLLRSNKRGICTAISEDYGHRHEFQTVVADILMTVDSLKYCRKHTTKWMRPEKRGAKFPLNMLGAKAFISYQPLGIIGIISPWNFPIQLCFSPLANVLSAGNRAMIKPSELTPITSALIATLVSQYFDADEVTVITGGVETASAFSAQPFDHLVFTGAPSVAKHVLRAAAENLVPVTLELGGKCPVIIGDGANLAAAVERIMTFKTLNAGQICLAPDYVLIQEKNIEIFVSLARKFVKKSFSTINDNEDYTSIINERHFQRLLACIEQAKECGATVIPLHDSSIESGFDSLHKIQPTLVINPPDSTSVMCDEIFGPVLPLKHYTEIGQVVDFVNARERPLALYYFGNSKDEIELLRQKTTSGGMVVNDIAAHILQETMPLGGVGHSGMGAYHGFDGFRQMSHGKAFYSQGLVSATGIFSPPYRRSVLKIVEKFMG